ncbi:hypothetical protein TNCV_1836641 [Trichonephila clavipes]|nr:hypothetical protein TNCV_1836641 [Trichonephila clavipes]
MYIQGDSLLDRQACMMWKKKSIRGRSDDLAGQGTKSSRPIHRIYQDYVEVFLANVNSVMWRSPVMLVPLGTAQRRRSMCCVKTFG